MRVIQLLILISIISFGCKEDPILSIPEPIELSKIQSFNGKSFITSDGTQIVPWGYNYTNPEIIGLIEDNWEDEQTWDIIEEDFEEMKAYAANVVRIHLQYNKFMNSPTQPINAQFDKLERLIALGESKGLYFIVTGLGAYRLDDAPIWYDALDDRGRWDTHKLFWKTVASTLKNQNAVFAYDLINEPTVANGCEPNEACNWYPELGQLDEFNFVQNISIDANNTYWETIAEWSDEMTTEIRKEDANTMITIGLLPLGPINSLAPNLDLISTHIYPNSSELSKLSDYLKENQSDKPLLITEFYNLHCTADELKTFISEADGNYDGIIGHYFGKKLEDHSIFSINDQLRKNYIEFMIENNPN